jgi:outer membrane protein assembly factor BamB
MQPLVHDGIEMLRAAMRSFGLVSTDRRPRYFIVVAAAISNVFIAAPTRAAIAISSAATSSTATPLQSESGNDWPEFRHDDQHTANNPYQNVITKANAATLRPKWTHATAGVTAFSNAVVYNGVVYQGDQHGFHAWKLSNGAKVWRYAAKDQGFRDSAEYYNKEIFVGVHPHKGTRGGVLALNAATGAVVWQNNNFPSYMNFTSSPLVADGLVYIGTSTMFETQLQCDSAEQLVALDINDGTQKTSLNLNPSPSVVGADVWSTPLRDPSGNLYVGTGNECGNANLPFPYANAVLSVTGTQPEMTVKWAFQIPAGPGHDLDFGSTPVFSNGMVIESSKDGFTYALDPSDGQVIWSVNTGEAIGSLATDGTNVYVPVTLSTTFCGSGPSPCGALVALNAQDGRTVWSIPTAIDSSGNGVLSGPAVSNGIVFAAYAETIWALDASTGETLWSYPTESSIYEALTVVNGGLLVGGFADGSTFYCFTPNGE